MAKAKKVIIEKDEVLQDIEELEETTSDIDEEEIEQLFSTEPEIVAPKETHVEVMPIRDRRFTYGGTWYYLSKGKKQTVPIEVKNFLLKNKQSPSIKDMW